MRARTGLVAFLSATMIGATAVAGAPEAPSIGTVDVGLIKICANAAANPAAK